MIDSIKQNGPPLLIFGLDAGDPDYIQKWVGEGVLPTIGKIMRNGCWGITKGADLISEHGVWVSLLSGLSRDQHGYYDFRQLKPGTYSLQTRTSRDAEAVPFWHHLRGSGKKIAIIDAQDTFPIEGLDGIQISNWATHEPAFPPSSLPENLLAEVQKNFGPQIRVPLDWKYKFQEDKSKYDKLMERVRKKGILLRHLFQRDTYDFIFAGFGEAHTGSHQFWKYIPESGIPPDIDEIEMRDSLKNIYKAIDEEIEQLLALLPANATMILITSAGMENHFPTSGLVETFCRKLEYQPYPAQQAASSFNPMDILRRVLPESVRIALSSFLPRETRENMLSGQFAAGTDWSRCKAFAIPSFYAGAIRMNLKGREPMGTVTRLEYDELLGNLESEFQKLIDPITGEPALHRAVCTCRLYGIEPPERLPDIFVKWKPHKHFMKTLQHPRALLEQNPQELRDSGHSDRGFIVAMGPQVKGKGAVGEIDMLDLAPTFLRLLNTPIPAQLKGKPCGKVL